MESQPRAQPPEIVPCAHCGKSTVHEVVHREDYSMQGESPAGDRWLAVLKCTKCERPSIYHDEWDSEIQKWKSVRVYPVDSRLPEEIPAKIRKTFEQALTILPESNSLAAVGIRKCIEGMCDDKRAQGKTLAERVDFLGERGFVPPSLAEIMQSSDTIRKIETHFGNMEISRNEVDVLIAYTLAVFECMYVAPASIDSVRARLEKYGLP